MTAGIVDRVNAWFAEAARPLPWREPGVTPWGVLVSEFMLQQTQASRVEPKWREFMRSWPDVDAMARASEASVLRAWDRLGYPRRARWLRACAIAIVEQHGGLVPADEAELRELPGVGPYTAAAVASFAHGEPTAVVDTNVRRVIARAVIGAAEAWAPSAPRDEAEYRAVVAVPPPLNEAARRRATTWNAAAMELGALVCTARAPACDRCPIADACAWQLAGAPSGTVVGRPRRKQAAYEGSDREMRGRILAVLRVEHGGVTERALRDRALGPDRDARRDDEADARRDEERFARSLRGLESDMLIERHLDRIALPGD